MFKSIDERIKNSEIFKFEFLNFLKKNQKYFISCFIIGILILLAEITNNTYYFEDYGSEGNSWNSEKTRWLLRAIMRLFGPYGFAPSLYMMFTIFLSSLIIFYLAKIWNIKKTIHKVTMFGIFLSNPFFITRLDYDIDGKVWYVLAQLLVVFSIYYSNSKKWHHTFFSVVFIFCVWAIYPVPVNAYISISLFSLFLNIVLNKFSKKNIKKYFLKFSKQLFIFLIGTFFYLISVKLFVKIDSWSQNRYKTKIPNFTELIEKLKLFFEQFSTLYFKAHIMYPLGLKLILVALLTISIFLTINYCLENEKQKKYVLLKIISAITILFLGLISYQSSSLIMDGFLSDFHTLAEVGFGYVFIIVIIFVLGNKPIKKISISVASILIFGLGLLANNYFQYRSNENKFDYMMTSRIFSRIENHQEYNPKKNEKYTVFFWGTPEVGLPNDLDFQNKFRADKLINPRGKSIYTHVWTQTLPLKRYDHIRYNTTGVYDEEMTLKIVKYISGMKKWPQKEFIKFINDENLIILKMGDYSL